MSYDITLEDFLANSDKIGKDQRVEIRGRIVSGFESGFVNFADTTGCALIKVPNSFPGNFLKAGSYVKLVNPEKDSDDVKTLVLTEKSRVLPTRRIQALASLELKNNSGSSGNGFVSLREIGKWNPDQVTITILILLN